ncbi:MAG: SPOR domain-containing protein, partial [Hylemonella sp.]|nr:SPOR domain-containing protein [Hylemonella sp.]
QRYVWVIQVGAYAQETNAQKALAQVQGLGLEAGAESFESPKGQLMRVRVGPFMRQAEADQAALRIKTLDLPVLVIRQRP